MSYASGKHFPQEVRTDERRALHCWGWHALIPTACIKPAYHRRAERGRKYLAAPSGLCVVGNDSSAAIGALTTSSCLSCDKPARTAYWSSILSSSHCGRGIEAYNCAQIIERYAVTILNPQHSAADARSHTLSSLQTSHEADFKNDFSLSNIGANPHG